MQVLSQQKGKPLVTKSNAIFKTDLKHFVLQAGKIDEQDFTV